MASILQSIPLEHEMPSEGNQPSVAKDNGYSPTSIPRPSTTARGRILWPYAVPVIVFHLLLPLAFFPYFFSWTGLLMIPLGNYVFCSMGIGAGYHRLLTHRSFNCPKWLEHVFAILGVCTLQDSPARWVVIHRLHHQNSDNQPDPHSPLAGFFWGHMEWIFVENRQLASFSTYERYAKDLLADPFYMKLERNLMWAWIFAAHALLFFLAGLAIGWLVDGSYDAGAQFGLSLLVYGVVFRTLYTWHVTWAINSVTHRWGYRNYETDENSRNNWIFGLATNGEGWHNNHHADLRCAINGFHRWWELDVTYLTLSLLRMVGLVTELVPRRARMARELTKG